MNESNKIIEFSELAAVADRARGAAARIVQCHGVFDLLHIGHIKYFQEAKKKGEVLIVTLTADEFVNKGPGRPAFSQKHRAEAIAALECVDFVAINGAASAEPAIRAIRPRFYVKGPDYKNRAPTKSGNLGKEEAAVREVGGELAYTDDETFSSSKLINDFLNPLSDQVVGYIRNFREKYSSDQIEELLSKIQDLNVLVVGEAIIDEYCFSEAIGKSGKEPVLVTKFKRSEKYAGGTVAIANHLAGFCKSVSLITYLGGRDSYQELITSSLKPNVTPIFITVEDRPTILKRRYLESSPLQKLFEVYVMEDRPLPDEADSEFCAALQRLIPQSDLVVVADYGHNLIGSEAKQILIEKPKFLALNTQANAGNRGFHTISAYPKADYVSLSESELRLDYRRREGDLKTMVLAMANKMNVKQATITSGKNGVMTYGRGLGCFIAPGFDQAVVDRVGSGDAVLALTSPLACIDAPPEINAFLANVAGSLAVRIVGNSSFIDRSIIMKSVNSLLK